MTKKAYVCNLCGRSCTIEIWKPMRTELQRKYILQCKKNKDLFVPFYAGGIIPREEIEKLESV